MRNAELARYFQDIAAYLVTDVGPVYRAADDLEAAPVAGTLGDLPPFGEKGEPKTLKGFAFVQTSGQDAPLAAVRPVIAELAAPLAPVRGVDGFGAPASIRR